MKRLHHLLSGDEPLHFAPQAIESAAELAGTTAQGLGQVADLASKLKRLFNTPKGAGDTDIETTLDKLALEIRHTQASCDLLKAQVALAKHELAALDETSAKLANCSLYQTASLNWVYVPEEFDPPNEHAYFICPNCKDTARKYSILQGDRYIKACKTCGSDFKFERRPPPDYATMTKRFAGR
ncbi:hypothetical protein FGG78_19830 [Thioclava sp. BHET1]|nr:hypothetical protein FGG78_19830 [Thioclava sp. BHET1]